jgi:hypothetical protein
VWSFPEPFVLESMEARRRKAALNAADPPPEAFDVKKATPDQARACWLATGGALTAAQVQLGLKAAMAGAIFTLLAMCALAAGVSLLIIYVVPPPGAKDLRTEMEWTRLSPFRAEHGTSVLPPAFSFSPLPSHLRAA